MLRVALASLALLALAGRPAAAGPVSVTFDHPEKYTDAALYGGYGPKAEQPALDGIAQCLERLGASYLPPHRSVEIRVLNLNLAGEFEPWHRPDAYHVRFMRDVYPPSMTVDYRLMQDGRVVAQGHTTISDVNYLSNPAVPYRSEQPLRYETAMLSGWFRKTFSTETR
jgi:DUF3016 family protein